jgi:hypothetical protein
VYGNLFTRGSQPITSPLFDIASTIYTMLIILTNKGKRFDYFDNELRILRQDYIISNLNSIKATYKSISQKIAELVRDNIFGGNTNIPNINIKSLVIYSSVLIQYINLAMCIYKWHHQNLTSGVIVPALGGSPDNYNSVVFKDFEILNIIHTDSYDKNIGKWERIGNGQTNNELLNAIYNYMKGKISIINI